MESTSVRAHPPTLSSDLCQRILLAGDKYFLESNDKISFFLEPGATDRADPSKLRVPKHRSVNKIGHALCQLDPVFRGTTLENDKIKALARDLEYHRDPRGGIEMLRSRFTC